MSFDVFSEAFILCFPQPETIWEDDSRERWTEEYRVWTHASWAFTEYLNAEAYLDAAMSLVPEGWDWGIAHFGSRGSEAQAWPRGALDSENKVAGGGDTPALAITAAALRARAKEMEE